MKKKILIVSLAANLIAGAFIFTAFKEKSKSTNDSGGYIIVNVDDWEMTVSDGNTTIDQIDLKSASKAGFRENNQRIAKELNNLKNKGYELLSSNGGGIYSNYVLVKR